jgi:hypothetical protein
MASVVLFGAGASFGSVDVLPYVPPLGNGARGLFARLDAAGGVASTFSEELKALFRSDFEKGMAEYSRLANGNIMTFQRELAAYFASFEPGPANQYRRLIDALGVRRVIYSSLNYDLLFELSAASLGYGTTSYGLGAPPPSLRLLKLHGSCNFWPDLKGATFNNCTFAGAREAEIDAPIIPLDREATLLRCRTEDSIAPAVAVYAEGKSIRVGPAFVAQHQRQWAAAVRAARAVFVIGVRVHLVDHHIWGPLATSRAPVTYFGLEGDKEAFFDWKRAAKKRHAYFVEATFEHCLPTIRARLRC